MGGLAIPAIEAVVTRVLIALGIGVAGGAAIDETQRRLRKAEQSRTAPIAQTDAQTQTRAKQHCERCPLCKGAIFVRNMDWSPVVVAYQLRIGGMGGGPGFINEWKYNGVEFDGVDLGECVLKEAKSTYDQFFDEYGGFRYPFQKRIFDDMILAAVRQNAAAVPKPPVQLRWYFMEPVSYRYMLAKLRVAAPQIQVFLQP